MAKFYPELTDQLLAFIAEQHLFFTASAPHQGRVNLSPKGMSTFRCLSRREVTYLDLTGSGNETSAHIAEDRRLTIMFCSFTEQPLILRLYGQGSVIWPRDALWKQLYSFFEPLPGTRQIIKLQIDSVQTSCGYGVPLYNYRGERETLLQWAKNKGEQEMQKYWREKTQVSIDGLPTGLLQDG